MIRSGLVITTLLSLLSSSSGASASEPPPLLSRQATTSVVDAYEEVHGHLVADHLSDALRAASELVRAATSLQNAQRGNLKEQAAELASAARKMAREPASKAPAIRAAFGEVSRILIALVKGHPQVTNGLHIFECPMAKGFKKWVQRDPKLANPYMGRSMPRCGRVSRWG